jgi:carbohydrate-binding DOMON domain-containing protein
MKTDAITTIMNFVLAVLVILCLLFGGYWSIWQVPKLRAIEIQNRNIQITVARAQALLNDTMQFNATAKNPELTQIIQSAQSPQNAQTPPPAAK